MAALEASLVVGRRAAHTRRALRKADGWSAAMHGWQQARRESLGVAGTPPFPVVDEEDVTP